MFLSKKSGTFILHVYTSSVDVLFLKDFFT